MRKILILALAAVLALASIGYAAGEDVLEKNEETGYRLVISDEGNLIDSAEMQAVTESMRPILEYANVGFLTPAEAPQTARRKPGNGATRPSGPARGLRCLSSI